MLNIRDIIEILAIIVGILSIIEIIIDRRKKRLQKEMDNLIGKLHSMYSEDSKNLYFNSLPVVIGIGTDMPDFMNPEVFAGVYQFWIDIRKNLYLTPKVTAGAIKNFSEFKLGERDISQNTFIELRETLKDAVNKRYNELTLKLTSSK